VNAILIATWNGAGVGLPPFHNRLRRYRTLALNYFNYFTEIEERFQQRRGSLLLLSTLDWALIEIWRESGIPVEAVLRGIAAYLEKNAQILDEILMDGVTGETLRASATKLRALAEQVRTGDASQIES